MATQVQYDNALRNSGGDVNNPMFKQWVDTYGGVGAAPHAALASSVNSFMAGQAVAPYLANLPNYANMVGKRSENTMSKLSGQLPTDVIAQIAQQAAERGIAGGAPASPNSGAAYLRALGLNSLQMQQQGSEELSRSIADTPVPELWNPISMYVPQQMAQQQQDFAVQGQNAALAEARRQEEAARAEAARAKAASDAWNADYLSRMASWKNSNRWTF